jgi:hypothetical protein
LISLSSDDRFFVAVPGQVKTSLIEGEEAPPEAAEIVQIPAGSLDSIKGPARIAERKELVRGVLSSLIGKRMP